MYSIKLNLSDSVVQYRASTMVEECQVSRLGHLLQYMREYCTMPRAKNRKAKSSNLMEDKTLCLSGYIIYLWDTASAVWSANNEPQLFQ